MALSRRLKHMVALRDFDVERFGRGSESLSDICGTESASSKRSEEVLKLPMGGLA